MGKLESSRLVQIPVGIQARMAAREASSTNWIKETKGKKRKGVRKRNGDHSEMIEKSLVLASRCGILTLLQIHSPSFHANWNLSTIRSCTRLYEFTFFLCLFIFLHAKQQTAFVWIFALVHCSSYTVTWSTQSSDTVRVLLHQQVVNFAHVVSTRSRCDSPTLACTKLPSVPPSELVNQLSRL